MHPTVLCRGEGASGRGVPSDVAKETQKWAGRNTHELEQETAEGTSTGKKCQPTNVGEQHHTGVPSREIDQGVTERRNGRPVDTSRN